MNRNPSKRLGFGPGGVQEIKEHVFFSTIDWKEAQQKKLPVPMPEMKELVDADVTLEKIYGRGAWDEKLKDVNRIKEWSFI